MIAGCVLPLNCTLIVFFVIGNVWFFYFTPSTTFSPYGPSSGNTSGSNIVNGGGSGAINADGT